MTIRLLMNSCFLWLFLSEIVPSLYAGPHSSVVERLPTGEGAAQLEMPVVAEAGDEMKLLAIQFFPFVFDEKELFYVEHQPNKATSKKCSFCHKNDKIVPLKELDSSRYSHWRVELKHASADTMSCSTCHNYKKASELLTLRAKSVPMHKSYESCKGCHSGQFADWRGGAHGKRVKNWSGKRVIKNCVGCHNPHAPSFLKRRPSTTTRFPDNAANK